MEMSRCIHYPRRHGDPPKLDQRNLTFEALNFQQFPKKVGEHINKYKPLYDCIGGPWCKMFSSQNLLEASPLGALSLRKLQGCFPEDGALISTIFALGLVVWMLGLKGMIWMIGMTLLLLSLLVFLLACVGGQIEQCSKFEELPE